MGDSIVEVIESVRCLNVSVTPSLDAVNRLLNDGIDTDAMLSVVVSTPPPYTVVVETNAVDEVSASQTLSLNEIRWIFILPNMCALKMEVHSSLSSEQLRIAEEGVEETVLCGRNVYI